MVQFKHNAISNLGQDFPNHFMSLCSETRKRRQFKFSVSSSLAETRVTTYKQNTKTQNVHKKTEGNKETKDFLKFSDQKQNTNLTLRYVPLYL